MLHMSQFHWIRGYVGTKNMKIFNFSFQILGWQGDNLHNMKILPNNHHIYPPLP